MFRRKDIEMIRAIEAEQKRRQEVFDARCYLGLMGAAVLGLLIFVFWTS